MSNPTRPSTAVVYLARAAEGLAPVRRFLESYLAQPSGREHRLIVLTKGFRSNRECQAVVALFKGISIEHLNLPSDHGFDLTAYFHAARTLDFDNFVFLNTFSRVLASGWLDKLVRAIEIPGIGLAGATGSYESHASSYLQENPHAITWWRPSHWKWRWISSDFDDFPNPHVRTNAFSITRAVLGKVDFCKVSTKYRAFAFESGRRGLTRQIQALGLRPVVIDRDGQVLEVADWPVGEAFRSGQQEKLLVADNQTDRFLESDEVTRKLLAQRAWGTHEFQGK